MDDRKIDNGRLLEVLIYVALWLLLFLFPLVNETISSFKGDSFSWTHVFRWWSGCIPYVILFLIHSLLLLPVYLQRKRGGLYVCLIVCLLLIFGAFQKVHFDMREKARMESSHECRPPHHHHPFYGDPHSGDDRPVPHHPGPHEMMPRHHLPMPVVMAVLFALILLGFNLVVAVLFKSRREQERREILENMLLQDELKYLKTQISPHFFMNMLNNIHSMVEVDPDRAQEMILELSRLMRYVLYEGSNTTTTFANEVRFISNYIAIMRHRYPSDKVEVNFSCPQFPSENVKLPPLLFIAFVENAFKHGVSYMKLSVIDISMEETDGWITFVCRNTKPPVRSDDYVEGGVGLENVKRRLNLLFPQNYILDIIDTEELYSVTLKIPGL